MMFFGWMWILIPVMIVLAVVLVARGWPSTASNDEARRTLDQRYAAGDIDDEEYRLRSDALAQGGSSSGSWWPTVAAVGVIAVIVMALLWTGMGSGRMWDWSAGHMGWAATSNSDTAAPAANPDAPSVEVVAGDLWFEPANVETEAGQPINLVLTNEGRVFHDLSVPELDLMLDADPGQTVRAGIDAAEPGTYDFLCTVPGHADAGMRGTLTIT